ncbi:hypothetical protein Klosneuvirus_4_63 [Medusavirus stheno T3]|uniref:Uncharacterized protein n=1 Tax=Medusavirus stheno T3 TaxID=3069717 RepID=A0A7S8BDG5_9VIRU|nr:hypothetical protein Klosneuvirus_4_63 [Acanthamoeba castellanii medusavirus]QPB44466.1 hypothetical protein Klosneuvirus_4_63 [Medusavirus stheno T3]
MSEDERDAEAYAFITKRQAKYYFDKYKVNPEAVSMEEWHRGMAVEMEHGIRFAVFPNVTNVTDDHLDGAAKIALAHFAESRNYYRWLEDAVKRSDKYWSKRTVPPLFRAQAK